MERSHTLPSTGGMVWYGLVWSGLVFRVLSRNLRKDCCVKQEYKVLNASNNSYRDELCSSCSSGFVRATRAAGAKSMSNCVSLRRGARE